MITKEKAIELLQRQLTKLETMRDNKDITTSEFKTWLDNTDRVLERVFGPDTPYKIAFRDISYGIARSLMNLHGEWFYPPTFKLGVNKAEMLLADLVEEVIQDWDEIELSKANRTPSQKIAEIRLLEQKMNSYDHILLHRQIVNHFNESELKTLCFSLNIDYEILPGDNKGDKARELILHCRRHNRTIALLEWCRDLRPFLDW